MIPDEGNRVEIVQRTLLYAGAGLSVLAVLVALMKVLSEEPMRMRSTEILPFAFLWVVTASWVLSPYWGAFKERQRSGKRTAGVILMVALVSDDQYPGGVVYRDNICLPWRATSHERWRNDSSCSRGAVAGSDSRNLGPISAANSGIETIAVNRAKLLVLFGLSSG